MKKGYKKLTFEDMFFRYLQYRKVCGRKELSERSNLTRFFARRKNYHTKFLTQQMVDDWCMKSIGETNVSNSIRIFSILAFLRYVVLEKKWVDLKVPETPPHAHETAIPHFFTDDELSLLFKATDEIPRGHQLNTILTSMEMPVMLRLILSAGLRPIEARMLRCQDVNLDNGIIRIENTKGYRKHLSVLHDSMLCIMKKYDQEINNIIKNRYYFFPNSKGGCQNVYWLQRKFREVWYKYNSSKATVGMLRHHYAITNINSVVSLDKSEMMKKLIALCKSMGHRSLVSTMWYYSLVPGLADVIDNLSGDSYKELIPVLSYEEN